MAAAAKINLSAQELQLMCNPDWILTKRSVMEKLAVMLGGLVPALQELTAQQPGIPAPVRAGNAKLHRGENYLGLPYLLLDCPAFFSRDAIFALRTFFWWGNFFSVTLHLSGRYKHTYCTALVQNIPLMQQYGLLVCVAEDEWQHHSGPDNYLPAAGAATDWLQTLLEEKTFVKIAARFELTDWEVLPRLAAGAAAQLLQLVQLSYPAGERGL